MILQQARGALAVFAGVLVVGVVGYRVIEGWPWLDALWMVVITLTTIGYGEVHPLSDAGRWFTLALVAGGLSTASFAAARMTSFVMDGVLGRQYAELKMRRRLKDMRDHVIVAGFGRTGQEVVADLLHAGQDFVIVERDPAVLSQHRHRDLPVLEGDASSDMVLRLAGVERACGMSVATGSDAVNVFITLSAHHLNPELKIITVVEHEESAEKATRAGAVGVINPYSVSGTTIANSLLRPHSATFMQNAFARTQPNLAMEDVVTGPESQWVGTLRRLDLRRRFGVIVVAVQRPGGEVDAAPGPDTEIGKGDVLVVVGHPTQVQAAREAASATPGDDAPEGDRYPRGLKPWSDR